MLSYEGTTEKLDASAEVQPRAPAVDRAAWWQVCLNIVYMLVAGPRGLAYLLVLAIGLAVDLPHLTLSLLLVGSLGLLYMAARAVFWLLRFGLRFLWVGTIVMLMWVVQTLWWVLIFTGRAVARIVWGVLVDIMHPRNAWQRAVDSMRQDRERLRAPRPASALRGWPVAGSIRWNGDRFVDACAAGLQRFWREVMPERWMVFPTIWRHLALWERRHTMRWLNVDLPPIEPPDSRLDRTALLAQLPLASLGYVLAKAPLGALALALVALAVEMSMWLAEIGLPGAVIGGALAAIAALIAALHLLAHASAHFAQRAFSPSAAVRRLRAAEALVVQERGKAERAEQSRRDLIINVGHELRTPTASILGHVESVLLALDTPDGHIPPDTLRTYLNIVQREAERLSALVDDLLAVARAERAELQLVLVPVDAGKVIYEVYQVLAPLAQRERQVMLVQEVQPDLPPLLVDEQRLTQVLLNLVRNAITYTPAGGIVSIELRRAGNELLLTIADTGSGIAPADIERVFERFYRADASRTRASGGFGLGLAIARDLVEAMGGTITAESILGEGSSFHVRLPIVTTER